MARASLPTVTAALCVNHPSLRLVNLAFPTLTILNEFNVRRKRVRLIYQQLLSLFFAIPTIVKIVRVMNVPTTHRGGYIQCVHVSNHFAIIVEVTILDETNKNLNELHQMLNLTALWM